MGDTDTRQTVKYGGLVGRERELERIRSFLARAAADGDALLLSGEPGVGKTVLLDAAAQEASAAGARLLRAAGAEFGADVTFAGLNQLLLPLEEDVGQLGGAHRRALSAVLGIGDEAGGVRLTVFTAVLALLCRAAVDRPLLVVVDDLQWLDRSSAAVLGFVARRLTGSRIGLIAASRTAGESFLDHGGLPENEVPPLDETEAAGLLGAYFPMLAPQVRRRVLAEAQGNPLALLELPAVISTSQRTARVALPSVLPLNRRLLALFASRVADLPAATRRVLLLAALDGTGDLGVLQAAVRGGSGLPDLQPAERTRLVSVDQGTRRLCFRHPLVRSTVVEFSSELEQRCAHRVLAEALTNQPERSAWHLAHATPSPDEPVASQLERAALRMLARGDAVGATGALLRAAELSPRGADRSRRLAEAAYVGVDVTGQLHTVPQLLMDARRADPDHGGSLGAAVATAYLLLNEEGDVDTARRLLIGAIEAKDGEYRADDRALIEALYTLFLVCFVGANREDLWEPFYAAVARLTPRPPAILSLCVVTLGDPARATAEQMTELGTIISRLPDVNDPALIVWIGRAAFFVDRMTACREAHWRVVHDGRRGGAVASAIGAMINLCIDDVFTGRWDEAQQLVEEGRALCALHGYRLLEWPFWYGEAVVAAWRGHVDWALELTDRMMRWAAPRGVELVRSYAQYVRAASALGQGDAEEAYQQAAAISPPGILAPRQPMALRAAMDLVDASLRTGRRSDAVAHVAAMADAGIAALSPRLALVALGSAGMAAPDEATVGLFEQALAVPGVERWPFDLARVRLAYGERLRRHRAHSSARVQLTAALAAFERLDARPWTKRAGLELRALGAGAAAAEDRGADCLTPQERVIAMLAATGLTNKQIGRQLYLSHRTVGAHLYRVFPKLGISSRAALRDALRPEY
ncbi:AAA family ATPase [Pseudonocardia alaniniphila]|uniref:LuxR family transcriptional regulator n=1 Tax=Pseudonocardia alaniniphila TaxID=75291 RepID=A0ABS9TSU8_9PSEU|nr:LuxR family transcriptional regulator [Pseudonocardia alaniniphila]MCH6171566.1 LuxR family transcriptional regulator [Pseudonocardia alaniniphila]